MAEGENGKFTVNITSIKQQNAGDEIVVTYDAEVTGGSYWPQGRDQYGCALRQRC
ncbi:MAG: hypothetical protein ACLUB5_00640 [Bifidobacterium dentium]